MNHKYRFSVFTPTYNAENIIQRLFDSLQAQTLQDFEWIVVDDCSKDSTRALLDKLIPEAKFKVKYIKNETNQMVSKNHQIGLDHAEGKFFIKLSHDDTLVPEALANFAKVWDNISPEERQKQKLAGVILHCLDKDGQREGDNFPQDTWISNDYEMRFKHRISGEKCSATLTEISKKYPFYLPEIDVYVPEDLQYFSVAYEHNYAYGNLDARVHIVNDGLHEHLEAQMGRGKKFLDGFCHYYEQMINKFEDRIWPLSKKSYLILMTNFVRYSRYNNKPYSEIKSKIKHHKMLYYPAYVIGNLNELIKHKSFL